MGVRTFPPGVGPFPPETGTVTLGVDTVIRREVALHGRGGLAVIRREVALHGRGGLALTTARGLGLLRGPCRLGTLLCPCCLPRPPLRRPLHRSRSCMRYIFVPTA